MRPAHTGCPSGSCDSAAVVVGCHDDGGDVAVTCSAVGWPIGKGGSCWACKEKTPVKGIRCAIFCKRGFKGAFWRGGYLRRTTCNVVATAAHGSTQNGAIADGADQRSECRKWGGDGLRGEIARYVLRRITIGAGNARYRDGIVEPDLIRIILHESQMALSTCCRRCESGADGGQVG